MSDECVKVAVRVRPFISFFNSINVIDVKLTNLLELKLKLLNKIMLKSSLWHVWAIILSCMHVTIFLVIFYVVYNTIICKSSLWAAWLVLGKRGAVDRASDSEYMNGCPAWVRARLVPQICVSFLCPWARHLTLVVPWFGGHVKPSVPCTCIQIFIQACTLKNVTGYSKRAGDHPGTVDCTSKLHSSTLGSRVM